MKLDVVAKIEGKRYLMRSAVLPELVEDKVALDSYIGLAVESMRETFETEDVKDVRYRLYEGDGDGVELIEWEGDDEKG